MAERVKKVKEKRTTVETPVTVEDMERLVGRICETSIALDGLKVAMEEEIMRVRERYETKMVQLSELQDELMMAAEGWAEAHENEWAPKRSVVMVHGTVGFRMGTPKLKTLNGWKWDRVLETLKECFSDYVRVKQEVDKDRIIADRYVLGDDTLRKFGVKVTQDESFFVEPNTQWKAKA